MPETIKVGVIGTSWWTQLMYLPSLGSHPNAEIVAICGRNKEPAKRLAEAFNIGTIYSDYRELLAHDGLDAVCIVTPDDTHHQMTLDALEAGLHVLCEKPLALNADDAREMLDIADAKRVKHMVLFTWRFLPYIRYIQRLVAQGYVGKCHEVQLSFFGGYALDPSYQWRFDGDRANGVCGDLGPHMIDLFRQFSGEVRSVSADFDQAVDRSGTSEQAPKPTNDFGTILLRGVNDTLGSIHVNAAAPSGDRLMKIEIRLRGEKGSIEADHIFEGAEKSVHLRGITSGLDRFETLEVPENLLKSLKVDDLTGAHTTQSAGPRYFIDAIQNDLTIPMSFKDGWITQTIVDAALRSNLERRWIDIAPES